jgi:tetratricopeptide (TPR) repeat protein
VHAISSECKADADVVRYYEKNSYMLGEYFYELGCYTQAAQQFGDVLSKRPDWLDVRYSRARALHFIGQHGPAIGELQVLLDSLRARDQKRTRRYYVSKEVLELMRGDMLVATQDYFNAKKAYARSLEENVAYGPAHVRLARVALVQDALDEALQEYDQALQIEEKDPVVHNDYGVALMRAKKWPEAEAQFRRAIELEPYFALPYFNLAVALDNQGKKDEAVAGYRDYLARAPRRQARNVTQASTRLAALAQVAGTD